MADEELVKEIMERALSDEGQRLADDVLARLKNGEVAPDKVLVDLKRGDISKVLKVPTLQSVSLGVPGPGCDINSIMT